MRIRTQDILAPFSEISAGKILSQNMKFPASTTDRIIEPVTISPRRSNTVSETDRMLRTLAQQHQLAYAYIIDDELLFADPTDRVDPAIVIEPFYVTALTPIEDAMRAVLSTITPYIPSAMNPKSDSILFAVTRFLNNSSTN
jgi:Mg/Co/Ni transporter MgtE